MGSRRRFGNPFRRSSTVSPTQRRALSTAIINDQVVEDMTALKMLEIHIIITNIKQCILQTSS